MKERDKRIYRRLALIEARLDDAVDMIEGLRDVSVRQNRHLGSEIELLAVAAKDHKKHIVDLMLGTPQYLKTVAKLKRRQYFKKVKAFLTQKVW